MTKIHHNTLKKAEAANITLAIVGDVVHAAFRKGVEPFIHTDPKEALNGALLSRTLMAEYPALSVVFSEGEFIASCNDEPFTSFSDCPTLADVLEAAEENGIDPETEATTEEEEASEERESVNVVAAKYRAAYAERGNPDHCGDWLAATLEGLFVGPDGFDHKAFATFLVANGVDMSGKWASLPESGQRGWQGRYRMNGRQKLEQRIIEQGFLVLRGIKQKVPVDFMEGLIARHPNTQPAE